MGLILSLLILSLLIFFHELGHLLVARFFNVRVEVFSIGFGKKIFSKVYGNTTYMISAIPLGGYVKMKGQDDLNPNEISQDEDSYNSKHPLKRIAILLAGPFANFFIAYILYLIIALHGHITLAPVIGNIVKDSPANKAGLEHKDKILSINGSEIATWGEMAKAIENSNNQLSVDILRENEKYNIVIYPKKSIYKNIFGEEKRKIMIGVSPLGDTIQKEYSFQESISFAFSKTKDACFMIIKGIEKLIQGVVSVKDVGGVISIVDITSKASSTGLVALLSFVALISVNLGILNLLPIPALDGGHIIFNIYEFIFKRRVNKFMFYYLTIAGWVILLSLMFLGIYNDINRLIE